jgi:hypothetical protein
MEDGNPNGYYVFYFEGNKVKPQFIPAGGDPSDRLRIILDPQLSHPDSLAQTHPPGLDRGVQAADMLLVVNFFDGGERDQVTLSLDGQPPLPMTYTERTDPSSERQYQKFKGTDDALPLPAVSSHIWQFVLPELKPGIHVAFVKAVDEFGFEDEEAFTFEIIEKK